MEDSDTSPRDITIDHETIREWVETRGGTPAHVTGAPADDVNSLYIVREDEELEDMEELSWTEFFEVFDAEGLAFVYQDRDIGETDEWLYDIVDREEIADRATLDRTEIEERLLEGEVVRSEITETKVIETTVIETEEIESEIVDSEIIETTPVDREILGRQLNACRFEDGPTGLTATLQPEGDDGTAAASETPSTVAATEAGPGREPPADTGSDLGTPAAGTSGEPAGGRGTVEDPRDGLAVDDTVVLDVRDTVLTTTEVFDRKTVESRVVNREISEKDVVESDAIDIEGIEETILESDLIEGELVGTEPEGPRSEPVPGGAITSEQTEGDVVRSQFVERRVVETESTDHHQISCRITDHSTIDSIESRSTVVERAIVDREADEEVRLPEPEAGVGATDEQPSAAGETATTPTADAELAAEPEGETGESGVAEEETDETTTAAESIGLRPTEDDIGKTVVSGNREIGMVSDVQEERLYVDPEPSLTDRIRAALDWGQATDDTYPVEHEQIEQITDEEVRIREL